MAESVKAKSGLRTYDQGDSPDLWGPGLKAGVNEFESRLGLTYAGNPNTHVAGSWYGQTCWDTTGLAMYECTLPGPAGTAVWVLRPSVPTGSVVCGLWQVLPSGYIPFDGTVRVQSAYPALFAVLPTAMKSGANFTLPLLDSTVPVVLLAFNGAADVDVGEIAGSFTSGVGTGDTGATALTMDQLPTGVLTGVVLDPTADVEIVAAGNAVGLNTQGNSGGGDGHTHPIGTHTHTMSPRRMRVLAGVKF